ncbi:hypothetical protein PHMEG_0002899 [Phytophthora megakarya]|uniref:Transposase n=1 Tax=Phytophthora megakarya TaxID=4795 RepID=A0A225WZR7_9STRA|nr:hypothetical protein PHMEG_0002899 [Phytophthora megakarya]
MTHCQARLAILDGNQNSNAYTYPLLEFLLPAYHHRYGIKVTFQHENSSIHSSKATKTFLDENLV